MRRDGAWTYVFGHLDPAAARPPLSGAHISPAPATPLPWRGRPDVLKRGLIARTPPLGLRRGPRMTVLTRVPCTVITGFLGAGKTTLIRHVLENARAASLAVIVNEFGDVGIDGEILKGCGIDACPRENIVELANGCLCCTVADEFVPALDAPGARPAVDHIVIETSGLALPKPLIQAFQWPAIRSRRDRRRRDRGRGRRGVAAGASPPIPMRSPANAPPMPRLTTTIRLKRYSKTRSPARISWCSTSAISSIAPASTAPSTTSSACCPRAVRVVTAADGQVDPAILIGLVSAAETDIDNRRTRARRRGPVMIMMISRAS